MPQIQNKGNLKSSSKKGQKPPPAAILFPKGQSLEAGRDICYRGQGKTMSGPGIQGLYSYEVRETQRSPYEVNKKPQGNKEHRSGNKVVQRSRTFPVSGLAEVSHINPENFPKAMTRGKMRGD